MLASRSYAMSYTMALGVFAIAMSCFIAISSLTMLFPSTLSVSLGLTIAASVTSLGVMTVLWIRFDWGSCIDAREALGLGKSHVNLFSLCSCVLAGVGLQIVLAALTQIVSVYLPPSQAMLDALKDILMPTTMLEHVLTWLAVVVCAPVFEELFFRGFMFRSLMRHYSTLLFPMLLSSLCFGLMHAEPYVVVYATVAGMVFAYVVHVSDSLYFSMAMHAGVNCVPLIVSLVAPQMQAEALEQGLNASEQSISFPVACLACLWVGIWLRIALSNQRMQNTTSSTTVSKEVNHE